MGTETSEAKKDPPSPLDEDKSFFKFIYELQRENDQLFFNIIKSLEYKNRRKILVIILKEGGTVDLGDIHDRVDISDRAVRGQLKKLEDLGLVQRVKGAAPVISFSSYEVKYLVNHALDCYYYSYNRND